MRDLFWLTVIVALGITLYLSHRREDRLRKEALRLDWKNRILEQYSKSTGWMLEDDGTNLTFTHPKEGKSIFKPGGVEGWNAEGSHSIFSFTTPDGKTAPDYYFPPRN